MNYLIDGHNLIGKMPDIQLSDPDDEAKLVLRLLNWAAVGKNRRIIVVFDKGMPGQNWTNFNSPILRAVFTLGGQTADDWLIKFMYDHVQNPKEYRLITSDRAIIKHADNRRIPFMRSEDFVVEVEQERQSFSEPTKPQDRPQKEILRGHEVDAWLQFFGGEPDIELKPYQRRKVELAVSTQSDAEPQDAGDVPREDGLLTPNEVAEWLDMFGGERVVMRVQEPSSAAKVSPTAGKGETKVIEVKPKKAPESSDDSPLTDEDTELWQSLFGDE